MIVIHGFDGSYFLKNILESLAGLLPVILYAEMHYRLPFFKGILFKNQPEILFDLPYRTETGTIPVLFLIKDAHRFPIEIGTIRIRIKSPEHSVLIKELQFEIKKVVDQKWYYRIFEIDVSEFKDQYLLLDCIADVQIRRKNISIINDNFQTLSQRPFKIFVDSESLPAEKGWLWGDLHCHSSFTEDQVEFGAPPASLPSMGKALGVSFCALTEHSYDLDNVDDSWIINDPELKKWADFQSEIRKVNQQNPDFLIIPGEEVSVDNGFGKTVHMAVLNDTNFHIGTGDGMEGSLGKETELHYHTVLSSLPEHSLAFAAHPFDHPSLSHRLLIHRGSWNRWDINPKLHGFQILNGSTGQEFQDGKAFWISQLLKGQRAYLYAGNDSHGNFNRFRQLVIPLLRMHEHQHQIFGYNLTGVKVNNTRTIDGIIHDLKQSSVIISNGPFLDISLDNDHTLHLTAKSSSFFGAIRQLQLFIGDIQHRQESFYKTIRNQAGKFRTALSFPLTDIPKQGYIRAELSTYKEKFALTNPVWF